MILRVTVSPGLIGGDVDEGYGKWPTFFATKTAAITYGHRILGYQTIAATL
jgi:hypothetical protein